MSRNNIFFLVIGALVLVIAALGYLIFDQSVDRGEDVAVAVAEPAAATAAPQTPTPQPEPSPGPQASGPLAAEAGPRVPTQSVTGNQPGAKVLGTYGSWEVRCDKPAGAQSEQCALLQFVTAADRQNVGMTVIVLKTADGKARLLRILAPLGVLLPSGLGLRIDDTDMGRAGFVRCLPNGCVAEVILEDELLTKLSGGGTATFIIFQTPEEGIGIPISLAGFGDGFAALP